jgi:hypothetical protein
MSAQTDREALIEILRRTVRATVLGLVAGSLPEAADAIRAAGFGRIPNDPIAAVKALTRYEVTGHGDGGARMYPDPGGEFLKLDAVLSALGGAQEQT